MVVVKQPNIQKIHGSYLAKFKYFTIGFPEIAGGPCPFLFTTIWGPIGRYNLTKYLSILKDLPTSESLTQISQGPVSGKSLGLDPEHMEFDIKKQQQLKTTKHNEIESAWVRCKPQKNI